MNLFLSTIMETRSGGKDYLLSQKYHSAQVPLCNLAGIKTVIQLRDCDFLKKI
jgi:hypothetical protein